MKKLLRKLSGISDDRHGKAETLDKLEAEFRNFLVIKMVFLQMVICGVYAKFKG